MFCTKCGKEVYTGDRFCGHCGCEVRPARATINDEIIFNPPFREEAKRKTEVMKSSFVGFKTTDNTEEPKKVIHESVNFDWGMDEKSPRKVDNSVFDWSGVVEQRKIKRGLGLETHEPARKKPAAVDEPLFVPSLPEVEVIGFAQPISTLSFEREEVPMSIEELEREIFGEDGGIAHKEEPKEKFSLVREESFDEKITESSSLESGFIPLFQQEKNETSEKTEKLQRTETFEKPEETETFQIIDAPKKNEIPENNDTFEKLNVEKSLNDNGRNQFLEEKFYTYHQKCDAFDELIEKERNYLSEMGVDIPKVKDMNTKSLDIKPERLSFEPEKTIVASAVLTEIEKAVGNVNQTTEDIAEKSDSGISGTKVNDIEVVADQAVEVVVDQAVETVVDQAVDEKNKKLRYSDIFPRVEVDANGNPVKNAENFSPVPEMLVKHEPVVPGIIAKKKQQKEEEKTSASSPVVYNKRPEKPKAEVKKDLTGIFDKIEIDEETPKKRHVLSKIVIFILVLLLLCEGVILGTKFFAPKSEFSEWVNDKVVLGISCATEIYSKITHKETENTSTIPEDATGMQLLVLEAASDVKKIGEVTYNPDILFGVLTNPAFPEVEEARDFNDEQWFEDKNGETKTYGQVLMSAIVQYFDGWRDINKDENLSGINKLEIGETRIGDTGFYTMVRVVYVTQDGGELEKYQTVYTGVSDESIVINMVKEETI